MNALAMSTSSSLHAEIDSQTPSVNLLAYAALGRGASVQADDTMTSTAETAHTMCFMRPPPKSGS